MCVCTFSSLGLSVSFNWREKVRGWGEGEISKTKGGVSSVCTLSLSFSVFLSFKLNGESRKVRGSGVGEYIDQGVMAPLRPKYQ